MRRLIFSLSILIFGISMLVWVDKYYRGNVQQANALKLERKITEVQENLSERFILNITLAEDLRAFMLAGTTLPDYDTFDRFAVQMLDHSPQVVTLQYVDPDLIVRHMYPLEGNEAALNLDLRTRPAEPFVEKAIRERQLTVNDPTVTVQGALSIVLRVPLYREDELLGLVQMVIKINPLLEDVTNNLDKRFQIQLQDRNGVIFWGAESLYGEVKRAVIPIGDNNWALSMGWRTSPPAPDPFILTLIWGGGGTLLFAVLFIINRLWLSTEWLRRSVTERTRQLETEVKQRRHAEEELKTLNAQLEQRITQRTEELQHLNIELQHANRAKDEFLASVSHELRTPLNSILGLSETLLEQRRAPLTEHQQNSLQIIESSGRHLLELINDVLNLSKIEAGKFDHYPEVVDVNILCRSTLAFIREQAIKKSITVNYEEQENVSKIYADPRRLKQVIVNLLTNAVKFTPNGGQVGLQVHGDEEQDLVQFSVSDTGIGIAPDDLKKLFQPFVQVDSSLNRQFEGTGLGLALVQKMVDMHGGSVQVESRVGEGSRFTVNLPWGRMNVAQIEHIESGGETPIEHHAPRQPETWLSQGVILLAEDNQANTLTIGEYLENHGYRVVNAHDGAEAIEKAEETSPDLILMDIQMPVINGLEAIRKLRTDPRFDPTPIIALTALAMPGDRERCLEAGANEYMSKPVSLKGLVKTIDNLLQNKN